MDKFLKLNVNKGKTLETYRLVDVTCLRCGGHWVHGDKGSFRCSGCGNTSAEDGFTFSKELVSSRVI